MDLSELQSEHCKGMQYQIVDFWTVQGLFDFWLDCIPTAEKQLCRSSLGFASALNFATIIWNWIYVDHCSMGLPDNKLKLSSSGWYCCVLCSAKLSDAAVLHWQGKMFHAARCNGAKFLVQVSNLMWIVLQPTYNHQTWQNQSGSSKISFHHSTMSSQIWCQGLFWPAGSQEQVFLGICLFVLISVRIPDNWSKPQEAPGNWSLQVRQIQARQEIRQ